MTNNDRVLNELVIEAHGLVAELSHQQRDGTNEAMFTICRLMDKNRGAIEKRLNELKYQKETANALP